MTKVAKVEEIIGSSNQSWEDAAQVALDEAKKTIRGINGIELVKKSSLSGADEGYTASDRSGAAY